MGWALLHALHTKKLGKKLSCESFHPRNFPAVRYAILAIYISLGPLGKVTYIQHKCKEFTCLIGETMRSEVLGSFVQAKYTSILMDGSTDCSVTEKELIYVMYVNSG